MRLFNSIICLILLVGITLANPIDDVEKCSFGDAKCMEKSFQAALPTFMAGLPELGVEVLDIMQLDDIAFDIAGLKFTLREGKLKGLKNSVIDKVKWDLDKNNVEITYHVDCVVRGKYTASGRVLVLPISGDGIFKSKMKNLSIKLKLDFDIKKNKDNKEHVVLKKYSYDYEVKDDTQFDLTNLFNGNKQLSDAMLRFLNDNWREVSSEFGKPIVDAAANKIYKNVQKFLAKVPIEKLVKE